MLSVHSSPIGNLGTNDTGGMSVCIREIARELGQRGHSVDIFTRSSNQSQKQVVELYENVRLIHVKAGKESYIPKLGVYNVLGDFFHELDRFRVREVSHYDLVHSHYWLSGVLGGYVQEHWGIPHLITFHTLGAVKNDIEGVEHEPERRILNEKQLIKSCNCIIASTKTEKEQLVHFYEASPNLIRVIPCGINTDLFYPFDKLKSRQRLEFCQNGPLLLFVGRFVPSKGLDRLLEAITLLKNNPPVRLMIVGGEDLESTDARKFRKLAKELGIQNQVSFQGRIEQRELPIYYSAADVLVVPSRYESFGLVALESLACGTPVVSTRVGAMESILQEGRTGHLVNSNTTQSLAEGIKSFASVSQNLSGDAMRTSVQGFRWENVATALMDAYENTLMGFVEEPHAAEAD